MSVTEKNTRLIKEVAQAMGFEFCGIAKAQYLEDDARRLSNWLEKGRQGKMQYMENHFDLRVDPCKLVPGAKSVITLLYNYYPSSLQPVGLPKISTYAYGQDYHEVIKSKLKDLLCRLKEQIGDINGRGFVDSAPVLERTWAQKSGLGWIGKNGNLINKEAGSFFFIASLIVDLPLLYDDAYAKDYCGSCTRCIDHCPTAAILPNKEIDGSKCISYFTIELKDALIPNNMKGKFDNWLFGCDACQDICPWNRFKSPSKEPAFKPIEAIFNMSSAEWETLSEEGFKKVFQHSPLKRTGYSGILRNLQFIST